MTEPTGLTPVPGPHVNQAARAHRPDRHPPAQRPVGTPAGNLQFACGINLLQFRKDSTRPSWCELSSPALHGPVRAAGPADNARSAPNANGRVLAKCTPLPGKAHPDAVSKHTRPTTGRRPCRSGTLTGGIMDSTTSRISSRTSNTVATANLHSRGCVSGPGNPPAATPILEPRLVTARIYAFSVGRGSATPTATPTRTVRGSRSCVARLAGMRDELRRSTSNPQ